MPAQIPSAKLDREKIYEKREKSRERETKVARENNLTIQYYT